MVVENITYLQSFLSHTNHCFGFYVTDDSPAQHCISLGKEGCHVHKISPQCLRFLSHNICSNDCEKHSAQCLVDSSVHMSTKMEVNTVSELLLPLEVPEMAIRKSFKHRIFFFLNVLMMLSLSLTDY